MKEKYYISGRITGLLPEEYLPLFSNADNFLKGQGYDTCNPVNDIDHSGAKSWKNYMINDIKHLMDCDGIYMIKNWKESKGARIEHAVAVEMELNIIYQHEKKAIK